MRLKKAVKQVQNALVVRRGQGVSDDIGEDTALRRDFGIQPINLSLGDVGVRIIVPDKSFVSVPASWRDSEFRQIELTWKYGEVGKPWMCVSSLARVPRPSSERNQCPERPTCAEEPACTEHEYRQQDQGSPSHGHHQ